MVFRYKGTAPRNGNLRDPVGIPSRLQQVICRHCTSGIGVAQFGKPCGLIKKQRAEKDIGANV